MTAPVLRAAPGVPVRVDLAPCRPVALGAGVLRVLAHERRWDTRPVVDTTAPDRPKAGPVLTPTGRGHGRRLVARLTP